MPKTPHPSALDAPQHWRLGRSESLSDGAEAVQHPLQQGQVGTVTDLRRRVDHDQVLVGHVPDQDLDDAQGKMKVGGHLGDGQDVVAERGFQESYRRWRPMVELSIAWLVADGCRRVPYRGIKRNDLW